MTNQSTSLIYYNGSCLLKYIHIKVANLFFSGFNSRSRFSQNLKLMLKKYI